MNAHDAIRRAAHDALCGLRIPHADHVWVSPIPFFDEVADAVEAAVSAAGYSITLTDDGAAAPAVTLSSAAEATSTAAPSSPHPCDHVPLVGLYDDTRTLTIQGSINHEVMIKLGDEEAFFTWADSFLATAHCAAYEAGEGATPATHRPTCGTTYGESCDGYCPTPAIDRGALDTILSTHTIECTGPGEVTCRGCRDLSWMSWPAYRRHVADAIMALIEGAQ